MIPWATIVGFATASLAIAITPGPSWIYVISTTVRQDRRAGMVAVLGNGTGIVCHVAAAAFGLSAIVAASASAFTVLRWAGAAYLVYLGLRMIVTGPQSEVQTESATVRSPWRVFRDGLLVNLLNPKVPILMLALLPQFVDPMRGNVTVQTLSIGVIHVLVASLVLCALAILTSRSRQRLRPSPRSRKIVQWASGSILVGLGVRLAFTRP